MRKNDCKDFQIATSRQFSRSDGDTESFHGSKCGESSPVEILINNDFSERVMFFSGLWSKRPKTAEVLLWNVEVTQRRHLTGQFYEKMLSDQSVS